jgi:hypothetical protein
MSIYRRTNHSLLVSHNLGRIIEVWSDDGKTKRLVKITGYGPPGSCAVEAVDGGEPIFEISTAWLIPLPTRPRR